MSGDHDDIVDAEEPTLTAPISDADIVAQAMERMSRASNSREAMKRKGGYRPPSLLPLPPPEPGWAFRYIRKSSMGELDPRNMSRRAHDGFVLCRPQDYPDLVRSSDLKNEAKDHIECGGLVLAKIPIEAKEEREQYYREMDRRQMQKVDSDYFNLQDRGVETFRMPGSGVRVSGRYS